MIEFSVGVDDLGLGLEPVVAPGTAHTIHVHDAENKYYLLEFFYTEIDQQYFNIISKLFNFLVVCWIAKKNHDSWIFK